MPLKAKGREVDTCAEDLCLCQNANTANAIEVHLHVGVAKWIAQISKVRSPCGVLGVSFHDNRILIYCLCQSQSRFRLLPGIQIIRLFTTQPVGKGSPNI